MCRLPSQAEPSQAPFPTDLSAPVSYHCAIQPSTINPDLSVLSSSAPGQDRMYGGSLDQPTLPLGLSVSFSIAISLLRLLMTHSLFVFLLRFPPSWFSFLFFFLHTDTPWALILFNFSCWLWRLGASVPFRFGLEWQAWLATGVFRFSIAIEFYCLMVLFPPPFFSRKAIAHRIRLDTLTRYGFPTSQ